MRYYIVLLFFAISFSSFAQTLEKDGKTYEVKDEKIFLNGEDVTGTLNAEEKVIILKEATGISEKLKTEEKAKEEKEKADKKKEKAAEKLQKEQKKAEKTAKKAEKERKKAEKALKKEKKLKDNYKSAQDKLAKAQAKYEKLKKRGKLYPVDETKWLEKIDKLSEKVEKAKRKL